MLTRLSWFALLAAVIVSGCGGNSKTAPSSAASLGTGRSTSTAQALTTSSSSSAFTARDMAQMTIKANTICARLNRELAAEKDVIRSSQDIARVEPRRAQLQRAATAQLSRLTPPAAVASEYQRFLTARARLAESTAKLGEETAAGNIASARESYATITKAGSEATSFAERHSLAACVRVG